MLMRKKRKEEFHLKQNFLSQKRSMQLIKVSMNGLVSLFSSISTSVGNLMSRITLAKITNDTIKTICQIIHTFLGHLFRSKSTNVTVAGTRLFRVHSRGLKPLVDKPHLSENVN